jgi:hypothetical protein
VRERAGERLQQGAQDARERASDLARGAVDRGKSAVSDAWDRTRDERARAAEMARERAQAVGQAARERSAIAVAKGKDVSARILERSGAGAAAIMERTRPVRERIVQQVTDPVKRERAITGAVVAGAIAMYAYRNRQDVVDYVQYKAIRFGLDHTKFNVDGKTITGQDLLVGSILKNFPGLEGTRVAEDPAAVLAYGLAAVPKEELMDRLRIVPDGRGGVTTLNDAIGSAKSVDDAVGALQLSSSVEGMALDMAESGTFGRHASTFAVTYKAMDARIQAPK